MLQLPVTYLNTMEKLLADDYQEFLKSMDNIPYSGLRVNCNKISVDDFVKIAPYEITPIPYIDNGFYINADDAWSKHPYYFAGLYYLQEPSAMLPANRLPIDEGDKVLDLCAAPGGKSTELYGKGCSLLVSNDISYSRTIPLVKNLEIAGASKIMVTSEAPEKLANVYQEYFDKILVDAPCSGEGMFRKDSSLIKSWMEKGPEYYCSIQISILRSAIKMLKPGGLIMYSTCTFSDVEDENVIYEILKSNEVTLCDIEDYEGFSYGYSKYVTLDSNMRKCVHVFPHKMNGEGHFMALLKKNDFNNNDKYGNCENSLKVALKKYDAIPVAVKSFIDLLNEDKAAELKKYKYYIHDNGMVCAIPEIASVKNKIRYVRTGLIVGTLKNKDKFIPHTAFALALNGNDFSNVLNVSSDNVIAGKYLRGETLVVGENDNHLKKGYVLICIDGYPLGFASYDGNKMKNMYEKGWRLN